MSSSNEYEPGWAQSKPARSRLEVDRQNSGKACALCRKGLQAAEFDLCRECRTVASRRRQEGVSLSPRLNSPLRYRPMHSPVRPAEILSIRTPRRPYFLQSRNVELTSLGFNGGLPHYEPCLPFSNCLTRERDRGHYSPGRTRLRTSPPRRGQFFSPERERRDFDIRF